MIQNLRIIIESTDFRLFPSTKIPENPFIKESFKLLELLFAQVFLLAVSIAINLLMLLVSIRNKCNKSYIVPIWNDEINHHSYVRNQPALSTLPEPARSALSGFWFFPCR